MACPQAFCSTGRTGSAYNRVCKCEVKVMFFGSSGAIKIRNAIRRILAKVRPQGFKCLEVTGIIAKRFLGLRFATLSAHSRHIQPSLPSRSSRDTAGAAAGRRMGQRLRVFVMAAKPGARTFRRRIDTTARPLSRSNCRGNVPGSLCPCHLEST